MSRQRTVTIPLEEYNELKQFKDKAEIGTWYKNFKNGFVSYKYEPETESIKKLQKQIKKLQEKLSKYRKRPTMETAREAAQEIVEQVTKENKKLKKELNEIKNKKDCRKCTNSKVSNGWRSWF